MGCNQAKASRFGAGLKLRKARLTSSARRLLSPVLDRRGRFSVLKGTTFALVVAPLLWIAYLMATGGLTPLPWVFSIYYTGIWALWFLLASLAVTPVRTIFGWGEFIAVRRTLGVAGLGYTVLHIFVYVGLDRFDGGFIVNEFATRPTVWVATYATVGMIALGVTSFDGAIRRLGAAAWNRLHYLAYPAIGLAVLHFDMSPGSFDGAPFLMMGIFFWLMAWRGLDRFNLATNAIVLTALAIVSGLFDFAFEVAWLALYQGIPAQKTVGFVFDIVGGFSPPGQMLAVGLSAAFLTALFGRTSARSVKPASRAVSERDVAQIARGPLNEAPQT
jgi:methionine sulfoxide reductase heme-binding subunit